MDCPQTPRASECRDALNLRSPLSPRRAADRPPGMPGARAMDPPRPRHLRIKPRASTLSLSASKSSSLIARSAARLRASRADRLPIVLPSGGSTSSSRSPRSSSLASGMVKVAASVTGAGCLRAFLPLRQGFARDAPGASNLRDLRWTLAQLAQMPSVLPRCINCRNFCGCHGTAGVCRVWQALLPTQVAASNRCEHWTAASAR